MFGRLKEFFAIERNVAALIVMEVFWMANYGLWWQFLPKYFDAVTGSIITTGILLSVYSASLAFFNAFGGYLSDIHGRKKILTMSLPVGVIGLVLFFFSDSWILILPGIIGYTMAMAMRRVADLTIVTESTSKRKMATARATVDVAEIAAMSAAAVFGGYFVDQMGIVEGFKFSLLIACVAVIISAVVGAKLIRETLHKNHRLKSFTLDPRVMVDFFHNLPSQVKFLITANCTSIVGWSIMFNYMVFYALDVVGITPFEWGVIYAVHLVSYAFFSFAGAKFSDGHNRKTALMILFLSAAIMPILFIMSNSFETMMMVGVFWGLFGFGTSSMSAFVADHTPKKSRGRSVGMVISLFVLSAVPGPIIGSILFSYDPQLPFIVGAAVCGISALLGWKLLR